MRILLFTNTTCTMQRLEIVASNSDYLFALSLLLPRRNVGIPRAKKMMGSVLPNAIEVKSFQRKGHTGAQATFNKLVHPSHRLGTTARYSPPKPFDTTTTTTTTLFIFISSSFFSTSRVTGLFPLVASFLAFREVRRADGRILGGTKLVKLRVALESSVLHLGSSCFLPCHSLPSSCSSFCPFWPRLKSVCCKCLLRR
jgi:hypothetical protein